MSYPNHHLSTIAIVGGDPVVGYTLEQMLLIAGYGARFLGGSSSIEGEANPFKGTHLVIIAPRSNDADRKALLSHLHSSSANDKSLKAQLPVLELVTTANGAQVEEERLVTRRILWPCPVSVLKREIEAALLDHSS